MVTATRRIVTLRQAPAPAVARAAGLRYVSDAGPGISRVRTSSGFTYVDPNGELILDEQELRRISALAIPPAWEDVWISPHANGHLQATGRDARGRKQYRYHPRWRELRDAVKFDRLIDFARALPSIRARTDADLRLPGLPREKVLAAVVRLLETTLIRVGNEEYARANKSFGLTTMRSRHADVNGSEIRFRFRGKSGKEHVVGIRNQRLARVVRRCQELPGQELFQYVDGTCGPETVGSADVNRYLRDVTGQEFTAKDFRTWAGTVLAALALAEYDPPESEAQAKKNIVRAIEWVAHRLGNTPAVCRKAYVHPAVLNAYVEGTLLQTMQQEIEKEPPAELDGLDLQEAAVLAVLEKRLRPES